MTRGISWKTAVVHLKKRRNPHEAREARQLENNFLLLSKDQLNGDPEFTNAGSLLAFTRHLIRAGRQAFSGYEKGGLQFY